MRRSAILRKLSGAEAKVAFTCNAYQGAADPLAQEEYLQRRIATFGAVAASTRPAHPLSAGIASTVCAEWPLRPVSLTTKPVQGVQLQIVGHERELQTPAGWARNAHEVLGGDLIVLPDEVHASVANGDVATAAVRFLRDGSPIG